MMDSKLSQLAQNLNELLPDLMEATSQFLVAENSQQKETAIESLALHFVNMADLSNQLDLPFLAELSEWADENILFLEDNEQLSTAIESFADWIDLLAATAESPDDEDTFSSLQAVLEDEIWPVKIESDLIDKIKQALIVVTPPPPAAFSLAALAEKLALLQADFMQASLSLDEVENAEEKESLLEQIGNVFVGLSDLAFVELAEWSDECFALLENAADQEVWIAQYTDFLDLLVANAFEPNDSEQLSMLEAVLTSDDWSIPVESSVIEKLKALFTNESVTEIAPISDDFIDKIAHIQSYFMEGSIALEEVSTEQEKEPIFENIGNAFVELSDLAETSEIAVLSDLAMWADENFALLETESSSDWLNNYVDWLDLLMLNLTESSADNLAMLEAVLTDEEWPASIEPALLLELRNFLTTPQEDKVVELININKPAEMDIRLWDAFLIETPQLSNELADILKQGFNSTEAKSAERKAHTVKGSCALVAIQPIASICEELESILEHGATDIGIDLATLAQKISDNLHLFAENLIAKESTTKWVHWQQDLAQLQQLNAENNNEDEDNELLSDESDLVVTHIPITKPDEMDIRLWDAFLIETPDLAKELSDILDQGFNSPEAKSGERKAHTVKGSCALVSITQVASICKELEDVLEYGVPDIGIDLDILSQELAVNLRFLADNLDAKEKTTPWYNWAIQLAQLKQLNGARDETTREEVVDIDPTQGISNNIAIAPPQDMDPRLIDAFFMETPDLVTQLSALLYKGEDLESMDIQNAQRMTHTIKGSLGMLGLSDLEHFTHNLEDLFELLENKKVSASLADVFIDSADIIETAMEEMKAGKSTIEIDLPSVIKSIAEQAQKLESDEEIIEPIALVATPSETKETTTKGVEAESSIRVPTQRINDLMQLVGELTTAVSQLQGGLEQTLQEVTLLREQGLQSSLHLSRLDTLVDVKGVPAIAVSVDDDSSTVDFDPLEMDQYHELHSITSVLRESMADEQTMANQAQDKLRDLVAAGRTHERLSRDINNAVLATRMRPVDTIVPKLKRIVREAAKSTHKQVILHIENNNLLADTDIISGLNDPLLHLLRNAVDHSIELPEERQAKGKSRDGHIYLRFNRDGNNITVQVVDDGVGFNVDKILLKAVKKGLNTENLSEAEILRLILTSGFSTKDKVSKLSGRGVGMDVVRESIESLKGTISLANSEQGGAEIKLSLPLTLVSVPVLLVLENEQRFAIPSDDVNQIFYADEGSILPVAKGWIFRFGNQDFSIRTLSEMLGLASANPNLQEQTDRPVLLIEHEQGSSAVLIDDAFERRDVVVQPLGEWLDYVKGVSGACILADGYVAPILELKTLLQHQITKTVYQPNISLEQNAAVKVGEGIVVVDDSLSARRSLQIATEQLGYNVRSAIDGLDAIEKIEELKPSVMLVDMEMPNMNGLELTSYIRANNELKDIIIIMVTSRSQEKHRNQAKKAGVDHYLTKPFAVSELQELVKDFMARQEGG